MNNKLFAFRTYNTETLYGWGDEDEANAYCDYLNDIRDINLYGFEEITDKDVIDQKDRDGVGINLCDALIESKFN